ncbi:MAG: type II toxin-antitoxin system HicB family antitoxin [Treponema sp.]|jgi:uncharacterized protein (DUF1778 family)|nr:type II toxin-antitoxin system HicB family antitoxin [Treponema sp.]
MKKSEKNIQISLRLPEEVLKRIDKAAEKDGRTRNNMIVRLICLAADKYHANPLAKEGRQ